MYNITYSLILTKGAMQWARKCYEHKMWIYCYLWFSSLPMHIYITDIVSSSSNKIFNKALKMTEIVKVHKSMRYIILAEIELVVIPLKLSVIRKIFSAECLKPFLQSLMQSILFLGYVICSTYKFCKILQASSWKNWIGERTPIPWYWNFSISG